MRLKFFIFLLFSSLQSYLFAQDNVIPVPVSYTPLADEFKINGNLYFEINTGDKKVKGHVRQFQKHLTSIGIITSEKPIGENTVFINLNAKPDTLLGEEGYHLEVNSKHILLTANKAAGIFYGIQTFKQLLPSHLSTLNSANVSPPPIKIRTCKIKDYPRFKWRGLMLDVSRHFFSVADVKSYIDKMAEYKFNTFHWHLTDDHGWRIEIKSLPKLTEIGAWRVERFGSFGRPDPKPNEKATYGGFYSQEEIRDIVRYAQERNITIVPEIDMPGHSMAALAAYPELSTKKEPKFVNPGTAFSEWYGDGKFKMLIENMLNPADEKVYEFADKVFTEVAALFPGEYIHMGGDECYHGYWEEDPNVLSFMKKHNIKDSHALQAYFVNRIEKIIRSKGKKMIGWDEIFEGELSAEAAVMSWRGMKNGIAASKAKHKVVMSPTTFAYLDYTQGDHSVENRVYADLSLEKAYTFDPLPDGADPKYILGGQGNLWAENIPTLDFAFYMTYPRAFALSESLWSPKENKEWEQFIRRTEAHFFRFEKTNTNISKAVYDPIIHVYKKNGKLMCELKNSIPDTEIYYTIDNTYPVKFGHKYTAPFAIPIGYLKLRTQTYLNKKAIGRELVVDRTVLEKRAKKNN